MRKHDSTPNVFLVNFANQCKNLIIYLSLIALLSLFTSGLSAQCTISTGKIKGELYNDLNLNAIRDGNEVGIPFIQLNAYNKDHQLVASAFTDLSGNYVLSGLSDGQYYQIEIIKPNQYEYSFIGQQNKGEIRNSIAPACEIYFALYRTSEVVSNPNPNVAVTIFNKANNLSENSNARSIVSIPQKFNSASILNTLTENSKTGAVYGLAWNKTKQRLYASAFVKQFSVLGPEGLGGIYAIQKNGNISTFINLQNLGIDLGNLAISNTNDCNYGTAVGKVGLGNMDISDDDNYLYITNLNKKSIIIIPTENPNINNVIELSIPNPGCDHSDYAVSAVKYYNGLLYLGVTCTAETAANQQFCSHHVYELNLLSRVFNEILSTSFAKQFWLKNPKDSKQTSQWLTDIDFNNRGEMILGIADRVGHTYCSGTDPLTNQQGDILVAYKSGNIWKLESGGLVNGRSGSGVGHFEGPDNGEFFGEDWWIVGPSLHQEVSFGTLANTNTNEVINAVFDPKYESFAGGLHRYNTDNGKLISSYEIYNRSNSTYGKSSGLGDIEVLNDPIPIEIGNLVWNDINKNGIQDANESGISGIQISLYNSNCIKVASTLTDKDGFYLFNNKNVDLNGDGIFESLLFASTYYVVLDDSRFDIASKLLNLGTDQFILTKNDVSSNGLTDSYDSDALVNWPNICSNLSKYPAIKVLTSNSGQNQYNFDIGLHLNSIDVNPPVNVYDLALIKKIVSNGPLRLNDFVEFNLEVYNQGNTAVDYYELVDYIPSQFEFVLSQNQDWISEGTNAIYKSKKPILAGAKEVISIKLKLINTENVQNIINVAEISAMKDADGKNLKDKDSTPDKIKDNDKGGIVNTQTDNQLDGDGTNDEDDQDPASLSVYDLALILTTNKTTPVKLGEDVSFQVRICNQGSEPTRNIKFIDYIPTGLSLSPLDNNGWMKQNSKYYNIYNGDLLPGQCITKEILLRVGEVTVGTCIVNRAEIVSFSNTSNIDVSNADIDSKADEVLGNDIGGVVGSISDNLLTGNGINDEDDEDPEQIFIADLALRKVLRQGSSLTYQGNLIFDISIFNQGCIPVKEIGIIDYLPEGFSLSNSAINSGWQNNSGKIEFTSNEVLEVGEQRIISIELKNTGELNFNELYNRAEINSFKNLNGEDISAFEYDSRPDTDPTNDIGAKIGTSTDDQIDDHGIVDEDDEDIAYIPVVDLALTKSIVTTKKLFKEKDLIEFNLQITNQGNTPVQEVTLVDYVDDNLEFDASLNSDWTIGSNNKVYYTLTNSINPGQTQNVPIKLSIKAGKNGTSIPNNAEIFKIRGSEHQELVDYDSKQDDILGNDKFDKSRIDDHGNLDEDDHDKIFVNPKNFDLALVKSVNKRTAEPGSNVEWTISVTNQGTIPATEFTIVDYLSNGIEIEDKNWESEPNGINPLNRYQTFSIANGKLGPDGLLPGETFNVIVRTVITPNAIPGIISNNAEIFDEKNNFDEPDDDSVPDDIMDNDGSIKVFDQSDESGSAGPGSPDREDDADVAGVMYIALEHGECYCLNNASSPSNGQFSVDLSLESRNNENWFIKSVNGLYSPLSLAPPTSPAPFITGPAGFVLTPSIFTGTTTVYTMSGIFVEGIGFDIILENQFGDKVNLGNFRCSYDSPIVTEAQNNVCSGSTVKYSLQKRAGSTYLWTLSSGGTIVSDPTNSSILVNWTGVVGTTNKLSVIESNPGICLKPIDFPVSIGNVPGAISCIGNAQVSLNANCEATITAKQLLVGGPYDYPSYAVMVFNKNGTLVPNATVNYSHVGKPLTAKVINTCNGNSCWTSITVEDKLPPTIVCLNDTIDCTRMKSHLGPFIYDNCDPNPTKILLSETIENTPCNPLYSKIVHRKYIAKDASGNSSKECNSDYFLKRIVLDSIVFPDSLLVIKNETNLSCGHYPLDSLGRPHYNYTGVPTYHGASIYPNNDPKYCDFSITYEDYTIINSNCTRKINRVWRVVIWYCTTFEMKVYNQIIEIKDFEPPIITCPYNKEVFTESAACDANVYIDSIVASDYCNNNVHINLTYPGGIVKNFKGGFIRLPHGENNINIEAFDDCYNKSYCSFIVNVIDKAAPVAICDKETAISLDRFGQSWVPAHVFDDGSYDNCHLKTMQVRRMDGGAPCGYQGLQFADSIGFCCSDVGKLIMVMFKVTDESGNSNTCMVQVEVQDKTIPHVSCPHNLTIDCDYDYNPKDLSEFGKAVVSDNCDLNFSEVDSFHINQCREGYIERIFIAGNQFGLDVCTQRIDVINNHPFEEKDIVWPVDLDTTTCSANLLSPNLLDKKYSPYLPEDRCDLVGVNYKDEVFKFVTGTDACFKIIRKWSVINWCRFRDSEGQPIIYTHNQIIKSFNKNKPRILTGCSNQRVEISDTSCFGGRINLVATADDDCTPISELRNQYEIDFDSDGRYEYSQVGIGGTIDASGFYKLGKHRIKYIFEDLCGNKEVCEADFEIVNAKLPVAYCRKGLAVGIEPMDLNGDGKLDGEFATVWAKDFDQNSYHPCNYDLTYSIGKDTSIHSVTYDCDSIGRRTVLLCVTASNGKQDCCETFIEVQDNNNVNLCGCLKRPDNITISTCERLTNPNDINSFPRFGLCRCDSNKVSYIDVIVNNIPNICYRIERNWTVNFDCASTPEVFKFTQSIDVTTDLKEVDIDWPSDSVIVDNCDGSIDTADIGEVPRFCTYQGSVMMMYTDKIVPSAPNTKKYVRTWNVFSKCVTQQSYFFEQTIVVLNPIGTKIQIPPDITVSNCKTPLLPDSLNGYPRVLCGCDSITYDYKDDTIVGNPEICYLVERNWIVKIKCRPKIDTNYIGIQKITRDVNLSLADIVWPQDTFKSFTCIANNNPNRTGRPSLKKDFCGLVTFVNFDTIITGATCNTVKRTWVAHNSCSASQIFKKDQFLISYNQGSISIICPPNLIVSADPNTCGAIVNIGIPQVSSPCNFGVSVTNNAPSVFPVGKTNVIFTAKDSCNHTAVCTTMVTVIENVPPTIICPKDSTVDCSVNTDNLNVFGTAIASDNCPGVTVKDSVLRNQNICGIGSIKRYFIATDASGNRSSCLQTITVVNNDPLDSLEINWPLSPITVAECTPFGPLNTGMPTITPGAASCFKVKITSKDTAYCAPGLCSVDRKWTVFDSCSNLTFMYLQKIIRNDTTAPTITGIKDTVIFSNDTTCSGFISLHAFVTNCDSNNITITNDSKFGGNGKDDASGFYPAGVTTVKFSAVDGCCNMSMLSIKITVIDTVSPEVTCKKVVKEILDNGCAIFNAEEFVVKKTDNCSPPPKIMVSFDKNNFNDTIRTICCDSIKGGQFTMIVTVYFKDEAGNISQCVTLLQAIDGKHICPPGNFTNVEVNGLITSRKSKKMPYVFVGLNGASSQSTETNVNGYYSFPNMPKGGSYILRPELDVDYLNGVSTYDIVLIQQHILGKKLFSSPYQYIAADVNKSKGITSADIAEIRKLILGTTEKFSKNKSWRFVESEYVFIDTENPLFDNWPEEVAIPVLNKNTLASFRGIKIGDVDDSQKYAEFDHSVKSRSNQVASILISDEILKKDQFQSITLSLKDWKQLKGAQACISVNPDIAKIISITVENSSSITLDQLNSNEIANGKFKFSWIPENQADDWKINVNLKVLKNSDALTAFNIEQSEIQAEAYSSTLDVMNLELRSENELKVKSKELRLYQNIPNPFSQITRIPFEINYDSDINLEIFDVNSKLVYSKKSHYNKGYHEIEVNKSNLANQGLYYYQIHTATEHINKRMLMID